MSERGSFVTEYINCDKCLAVMKDVLLTHKDTFFCGSLFSAALLPGVDGDLPIIGGKVGGLSENEEFEDFRALQQSIGGLLCRGHSVRIAVLADSGASQIVTIAHK
jgi:hypothetical protein